MIFNVVKITIKNIRRAVKEALIKASDAYMKKEVVRSELEKFVKLQVKKGHVTNQAELDELFQTFNMAMNALKMVPYEVWQKQSGLSLTSSKKSS